MKRLKFKRKNEVIKEYSVTNKRGDYLGDIAYMKVKGHRKEKWWFFPETHPFDTIGDFWLGESCLREIADKLKELKDASCTKEVTE